MYFEVDIVQLPNGKYQVDKNVKSSPYLTTESLLMEQKENIDGLFVIGEDELPEGAEDIRNKVDKKLEKISCFFDYQEKKFRYIGIRFLPTLKVIV